LAQAEATTEELRTAVTTTNKAAEKAIAAAAVAAETADRTAAQAATREKTTLESRVAELEQDLATAGADHMRPTSSSLRWPTSFKTPPTW
jgi:hypothetical protein